LMFSFCNHTIFFFRQRRNLRKKLRKAGDYFANRVTLGDFSSVEMIYFESTLCFFI
jgi:hypothetical protein